MIQIRFYAGASVTLVPFLFYCLLKCWRGFVIRANFPVAESVTLVPIVTRITHFPNPAAA